VLGLRKLGDVIADRAIGRCPRIDPGCDLGRPHDVCADRRHEGPDRGHVREFDTSRKDTHWESESWRGQMTDQELLIATLRKASRIIGEYLEPGPRDADETIAQLIAVLDNQDLALAIERLEKGHGLRFELPQLSCSLSPSLSVRRMSR